LWGRNKRSLLLLLLLLLLMLSSWASWQHASFSPSHPHTHTHTHTRTCTNSPTTLVALLLCLSPSHGRMSDARVTTSPSLTSSLPPSFLFSHSRPMCLSRVSLYLFVSLLSNFLRNAFRPKAHRPTGPRTQKTDTDTDTNVLFFLKICLQVKKTNPPPLSLPLSPLPSPKHLYKRFDG